VTAARMLGLTLTQPWATLVAVGAKRVDTRDWDTDYRGPLAIHAAKGLGGLDDLMPSGLHAHEEDLQRFVNASPFWDELRTIEGLTDENGLVQADRLPRFAIVAVCELADVLDAEEQEARMRAWAAAPETETEQALRLHRVERELALGNYGPDRYAWRLTNVRRVDPPVSMPPGAVRYYRKLWRVPDDIAAAALGQAT
jgi:hypothetical protein